jgi:Peptidase family M1 domain
MRSRCFAALAAPALALPLALGAQLPAPPALPPTNQAIFAPLELPPPSDVRTGAGAPGPAYWQQEADYDLKATLDTTAHRIRASEVITYVNNSPDTLPFLWLQLEQNLFSPDSRGALINSGALQRWRGSFPEGGLRLGRVTVVQGGQRYEPGTVVDDTRMRLDLNRAMRASGDTVRLELEWTFVVPEYGADRMGRLDTKAGWVYEIAQWYPRMVVYDDVNGWNPMPYLGQGEFYLEYGDFHAEITAPRDMIVVASGELLNPDEVLTPAERERLTQARTSDRTVSIVAPDEVGRPATRPGGTGPLTWKFRIRRARDLTWAASRAFIWDAAGWDGVLLQSVYPREGLGTQADPGWERSTEYLRHTISYYSTEWFRFPWPTATNVAGIVGGMEYPGIVFCSVDARGQGLFGVTDHEFGHSWFPMIVGSDERRYAWMDEGFNTFINYYSNVDFYGPGAQGAQRGQADFIAARMQEPIADQPIMTYPDLLRGDGLGFLGYRKPGFGLILLRETILGEARFKKAMRTYVDEWAFRHPKPWDFFRTIEDVSGEQLAWFWRGWFYGTQLLDQSVTSVEATDDGTVVHLRNDAGLVMPVLLHVVMADGRTVDKTLPVEIWARGNTFDFLLQEKGSVVDVVLDPDHHLPDANRANNEWHKTVSD